MTLNTAFARRQMVRQQVRTCDVLDERVLATLQDIHREHFVPERFAHLAYADVEIPLGHDQSMLMPSTEGQVLDALTLSPQDRILEIGTGSGFMTACLAQLGASVVSLEVYPELHEHASRALAAAGIDDVELMLMDAMQQLPDDSFDAIAVTGSTPELDERFCDLLRPEGRMLTFVGELPIMQARLVRKDAGGAIASDTALFEIVVPPLVGAARESVFAF